MNHKTLSDFRVGHGALLEGLLVDSFAELRRRGWCGWNGWRSPGIKGETHRAHPTQSGAR